MTRALDALRAAAWWALLGLMLLWWAPELLWRVGAVLLGRARFHLAIGLGRALVWLGLVEAGRRVFAAERLRAGRRLAALRSRREW